MIPKPFSDVTTGGDFAIPETIRLEFQDARKAEEELYRGYLNSYARDLSAQYGIESPDGMMWVRMLLNSETAHHPEGYVMIIESGDIRINASTLQGLKSGFQSLLQLVFLAFWQHHGRLQERRIVDKPRFAWRGLHLDVSRHWFGASFIRQYLEWMEALKLNRFHWHLADDQGWRLESERFPLLHQKGAWRKEADGTVYGGFYRKDEIRELVAYAASMGIEVIPEIDIPGHAQAILAAYPGLACFPQDFECLNVWGISTHILCAGKDETISFLEDLLSEVAELFPGPYIHLGGDEAPKDHWKSCPHCQKRIREQGLKDEEELQSWLLKKMSSHLRGLGKQVIGWDEILDGNIDSEPIVMVWRGDGKDAVAKAEAGGNAYILCPNSTLYFDWKQHYATDAFGSHGVSTLEHVYSFDPMSVTGASPHLLLGAQANVWTEYMPDPARVKALLFPRAYALAELLWTPQEERDEADFLARLKALEGYL